MQTNFSVEESISNLWDKLDGWLESIILKLPNFAMAVLVMFLFYFLARGIRKLLKKTILRKISQVSIQEIIAKVVFVVIILIGFFIALGVLDLDKVLTSILAGAGVVGLAIGLALQGTLSNTFGGLILSFMPQLKINDFITADGVSGFVTEISLRNIILKKPDNNVVVIPNSKFIDGSFTNYSMNNRNRIFVNCGVGYESDLQMVEDLTVKIISDNFQQNDGEDVEFFFTEFGDSSINFMVRFWADCVNVKQEHAARHKAIKIIKKHFDERDINIPFPIRTLDFGKNNLQIAKD
ncbi:MAG: mechanosensitive ion channel family protein [Maribacter dokdonensis]|uniref:Small conductance mechanosensitive channel n=3 Tax=Maribacter dokdonensis TaxID=320912 RepID=A0A1H4TC20_9FLAO|nr:MULTISPECIES: mechanosensitive ion channel family protein [Maribacter]HAF76548.1 mechanosensitive ion channel family protein [Maribacter sp.]APA62912.1 mechanosensitive ion channel protein MscS [Maribacter sp. 1_2014MBL_MicDiv]KSA14042.1 Potassium efflux system KefA protein / Small-conductance mechanosensitive channel [Maribacter dokdonensis DSW-8]MBU2902417.1 mechanosensitive ion channel family protein [Maribacter dokdonensis]MDP2524751.1 mechanosensitive ion channel family protein [Mariba|tara:strand:+ start:210622 stop:211503 length:882 start_codon:yes stop_codon:yes gene_type:complete